VLIALATLVAGYLGICLLLFTQQRRILFPAPKRAGAPATAAGSPTVVYFHGNAEAASDMGWLAKWFAERGLGFVAVEYPGYGETPGAPSEDGIYAAAEAALKPLPRESVIIVGQSLGTGPAVEMAARGYGTRLVLLTPFTSIGDAAQLHFPWLPAKWLVRDQFDSASKASRVKVPVLVVHGDQDEVVPYVLGQRLAPMFTQGTLMTVPGGHHNDLWDRSEVRERIGAFLSQNGGAEAR
jgi:pimeloyl-ACP methyl ester carboxylesterase